MLGKKYSIFDNEREELLRISNYWNSGLEDLIGLPKELPPAIPSPIDMRWNGMSVYDRIVLAGNGISPMGFGFREKYDIRFSGPSSIHSSIVFAANGISPIELGFREKYDVRFSGPSPMDSLMDTMLYNPQWHG